MLSKYFRLEKKSLFRNKPEMKSSMNIDDKPNKSSSRCLWKKRLVEFTILSLLIMGFLYILIYTPFGEISLFSSQGSLCSSNNPPKFNMTIYRDELDEVLAKTSTPNKTVIIAVVNKAYCEGDKPMLDIFLDGFWIGENTRPLKDHLLIVAVDQTAYQRCRFLGLHCYRLETDGVDFDGEKLFMSNDFLKMMWRRTLFLGDVLKRGYNFIFTDTDVLWLRNPFTRLSSNETFDLHVSTDMFFGDEWNRKHINTGFYFARSNNKTISLFDLWYSRKDNSTGMKEQDVLISLIHEKVFSDLGIKIMYLNTNYFSGICQNSNDVRSVVTFHTNCCRSINAKVAELTAVIQDWKRYKGLKANETDTFRWSNYTNCKHSWTH